LAWRIEYDPRAIDDLNRFSHEVRREIIQFLETRIASADSRGLFGRPLRHGLAGLWRYRVRDYRIVCQLRDQTLIVLVAGVGHRRDVYRPVR
jgi:mRNA interferase RelE/StbE